MKLIASLFSVVVIASLSHASDFILNSQPVVNVTVTNAYTVTNVTTFATNYVYVTNSTTTYVTNATLSKTGQQVEYVAYDDGSYERGVEWVNPRFVIAPAGLTNWVLDSMTGLIWSRSGMALASDWQDAIDQCNAYTDGGYNDWRLPNALEMMSIMTWIADKPSVPDTAGTTNQTANGSPFYKLSSWKTASFWTSTTLSFSTNMAVVGDVGDATVKSYPKATSTPWYWPIRN